MTIETNFNISDEVWFAEFGEVDNFLRIPKE
jgi:hypothetical protein